MKSKWKKNIIFIKYWKIFNTKNYVIVWNTTELSYRSVSVDEASSEIARKKEQNLMKNFHRKWIFKVWILLYVCTCLAVYKFYLICTVTSFNGKITMYYYEWDLNIKKHKRLATRKLFIIVLLYLFLPSFSLIHSDNEQQHKKTELCRIDNVFRQ